MQARTEFSMADALAMYKRLRMKGQTGPLARLSIEGRYGTLTSQQRQQLRQLLINYDSHTLSR